MTDRAVPPEGYDPGDYPPFAVTVDVVVLTIRRRELHVLLVERRDHPHAGALALPGGFVRPDESLAEAAARELEEETAIRAADLPAGALVQLRAYGDPDRDPRMRVVTVAFLAVVSTLAEPHAGGDATRAALLPVSSVLGPHRSRPLAFDHAQILTDAIEAARQQLETTSIATAFVGPEFTLAELREVYEAAWGEKLDPGNFRRKVLSLGGLLSPTGRRRKPGPEGGKPAETYTTAEPAVQPLDQPLRWTREPRPIPPPPMAAAPAPASAMQVRHAMELPSRLPSASAPDVEVPDRYPNDFGDDPWDNDTVEWLMRQPGVADEWNRVRIFEALRRQKRLVDADHPDIARAEAVARQHGIRQITVPRGNGTITRLQRTDPGAPRYPRDEAHRTAILRAWREGQADRHVR